VGRYLQDTCVENLQVLLSGPIPPNPDNLLESGRIEEFLVELKAMADIVLFDSPPVLVVADAAILGTQVDGVLLVLDAGHTRLSEARHAADVLRRLDINLLGTILNRSSAQRSHYYYYYYNHENGRHSKKNHSLRPEWMGTVFSGLPGSRLLPGRKEKSRPVKKDLSGGA
jgi:capsular exopolysaccharide synthesis family protein